MTSYQRRLTGPQLIADHDRRIDDLERALRVRQTDLRRRRSSASPASFVRVRRLTNQSIPNATNVGIIFDDVQFRAGPEDVTLSGGNLVFNVAGLYTFTGACSWTSNATGRRLAKLAPSATQHTTDRRSAVSGDFTSHVLAIDALVDEGLVGAGVELAVEQNSGAALDIRSDQPCFMTAMRFPIPG
jgi:hypothetical protein